MRVAAKVWLALAPAVFACARGGGGLPEGKRTLMGLEGQLESAAALRLALEGAVDGRPAQVVFDLSSPLTTVSSGCFSEPPVSAGEVRWQEASGKLRQAPELPLDGVRVEDRSLPRFTAAVVAPDNRCELSLGLDQLGGFAFHIDPVRRRVTVSASQPRVAYGTQKPGREVHVLPLERDPQGDWPLLVAQFQQGRRAVTGPFVLATREPRSKVAERAAKQARIQGGLGFLEDVKLPMPIQVPLAGGFGGYAFDQVRLSPELALEHVVAHSAPDWTHAGSLGWVGSDVWGRFFTTVDLPSNVLVLERPRRVVRDGRERCEGAGGALDEAACFSLHSRSDAQGLSVTAVVWRELPEGGRLYIDPVDAAGVPIASECRLGFTFSEADPGASTWHRLPWDGLARLMPGCGGPLRTAKAATPVLFEEGALKECPGSCAFAQHLASRRILCECQGPEAHGASDAERQFLELYRKLLENRKVPRAPLPPIGEPPDPE